MRQERVGIYARVSTLDKGQDVELQVSELRTPFDGKIGRRLVEQMTKTKEGRLFYPKRGKSVDGGFRIAFDRACKRLGIDGLCFHDFRHTAITNMRKAGVDTSVIVAISGNKTLSMFQRYNKVDMDDKVETLNRLNRYFGAKYEPHALTE